MLQGDRLVAYLKTIYTPYLISLIIKKQKPSHFKLMFYALCSVSMHTYAVMGLNTALIQAALLSRARVHTIVPAKMEARIDLIKGNFKLQFLPVQGIDKVASALYVLNISKQHVSPGFESFLK